MECIHYSYRLAELFFPSYKIFYKFCSSTEKTTIFLISLIRLFIVYRLFMLFDPTYNMITKYEYSLKYILLLVMFVYFLINLIYLIVIPFKVPDYDQLELENEAEIIAMALKQNEIDKSLMIDVKEKNEITSEVIMTYDKQTPISTTY